MHDLFPHIWQLIRHTYGSYSGMTSSSSKPHVCITSTLRMIRQNLVNVILTGHENKFLVKNSTKYHYKMRLKCKPLQYEGTFTFGRISNKKGFVFAHSILYCPFLNSNLNRTFANMSHMEEKMPPGEPPIGLYSVQCTPHSPHRHP